MIKTFDMAHALLLWLILLKVLSWYKLLGQSGSYIQNQCLTNHIGSTTLNL